MAVPAECYNYCAASRVSRVSLDSLKFHQMINVCFLTFLVALFRFFQHNKMLTQLTINRYRRSDNLTIAIVPQMSAMAIKEQF